MVTKTRRNQIRALLRQLAIRVDPAYASLTQLAHHVHVHPRTLQGWVRAGYVPRNQALSLLDRFGVDLVDVDILSSKPKAEARARS